ncbi:hypothetical protein DVH05_004225 [Phytophthora capsici]|nr:hypothetical protein DVH05_004223 [Phytophthora capsici]KAG1705295.1 hypothetical protein DVH05_004224 [Phytophthora capsici]KAG1705296.1 hypothetical protein DVH05_004225 [Phytophthora capsici]
MRADEADNDRERAELYVATVRPGMATAKQWQATSGGRTRELEETTMGTGRVATDPVSTHEPSASSTDRETPGKSRNEVVPETGEGAESNASTTDTEKVERRRVTAQRRMVRRAARKEARHRRQTQLRTKREETARAAAERTQRALETRLNRVKDAVDGLQALHERRERRKPEPSENEGDDRSKPVPVRLVKRLRRGVDPLEAANGVAQTLWTPSR